MSLDINFELNAEDFFEFQDQFVQSGIDRILALLSAELTRDMKVEAPVNHGRLASSIGFPVKIGSAIYGIKIGAGYWRFVQFGTQPHDIEPVKAKALAFKTDGDWVICKRAHHPGTKPNPFITRAMKQAEKRIAEFTDRVIKEMDNR